MYGTSPLPKSSLLDRISPKGYSPPSGPARELPPLSPQLGDYLDSQLGEEEEEEQVIRVLDSNQELVFQRDPGTGERQDRDGDFHHPRNTSPMKKRKLVHPTQPTNTSTSQTSPAQESNSKTRDTSSELHSPSPQPDDSSPKDQPLTSRAGFDWSSGSSLKGGSRFGKLPGLAFGFAGYGYDSGVAANTTGEVTSRDRVEAAPVSEPLQYVPQVDEQNFDQVENGIDTCGPTPLPTTVGTREDQSDKPRGRSKEGEISNGEVPLEGGEDHDLGHEANHEGRRVNRCDAPPALAPPLTPPSHSEDNRMESPPPREFPPPSPKDEERAEDVAHPTPVAPSRTPSPTPKSGTPHQSEGTDEEIKTIEQHAEDLLQDIQKEYLSRTEARAAHPRAKLEGFIPGLPENTLMSPHDDEHPRISPTPSLDGISHLTGARFTPPTLGTDHRYIASDAMSASTHTPKSTIENLPSSITRSTSDLDSNDTLLGVDPELDQITKQALGDLIVHNLKLSHNLDADDAVRRAIKLEVDEHARDFLRLATKLARRMDMMGEPLESIVEARDVEPNQLLSEPILPDTAENGYLEYLPPVEGSEYNEEPQPHKEAIQRVASDVEMDSVPLEVSRSGSEDRVKVESNDEPAGEQELDTERTDEHVERVDHAECVDEDDSQESGLEIPGVWCARTGKDRTDTIQEHIEVSEVLAARVRKWVKKTGASEHEPGRGPVMMNMMCLQTSVMQELYASFEGDARPVGDFFHALKALKCTWPTGGKLMIQVKAGEPERTRTWFSHQLIQGKPLDISSVIHPGRVTLQFVQLSDLSSYVFLLLVSEPGAVGTISPRKAGGIGSGGGSESRSKVDKYLSRLEFTSSSTSS